MTRVSPVYTQAERMHSALFTDTANRSRGGIGKGEVRAEVTEPYGTERLTVFGEIDGRPAYQTLSKSVKTGVFYLATVFTEPNGEVLNERITEGAVPRLGEVLEETLLMDIFRRSQDHTE